MTLSTNEIRVRAAKFAEDWKEAHYERIECLLEMYGIMRAESSEMD